MTMPSFSVLALGGNLSATIYLHQSLDVGENSFLTPKQQPLYPYIENNHIQKKTNE